MDRPAGPTACGCADAEKTYAELARYCDEIGTELEAARGRVAALERALRPRDADHASAWLYERAEDAAVAGLPEDRAVEAARNGFSSVAADRMVAEDP